jgi:AAA+ superfamily predicted ATPase
MSTPASESLGPIAIGAVEGDPKALALFREAIKQPEHAPTLADVILQVARESTGRLEELQEKLRTAIGPALLCGAWEHEGALYLDVELNGTRAYCVVADEHREAAELAERGEEIVVARVDGSTPFFVRSQGRPFETTGHYGVVTEVRELGGGDYELEIEGQAESFTCRATRRVACLLERGEVDALGGLPIMARHAGGLVWELRQKKGKAEIPGNLHTTVTLEDYAGYSRLRREYCSLLGLHVLQVEPKLLVERTPLSRAVRPKTQGILATGLPGTGKTFLSLAVIGSLQTKIGVPKAKAKLAALRLFAATHPEDALYQRAGQPSADAALADLRAALAEQYEGLRQFELAIETPALADGLDLCAFSEALVEQYGITKARRTRKYADLEQRVAEGRSDFMVLQISKSDYIQPLVGAGLNALSAQLKRCVQHDDVALLCLPEAEVLLARRGHRSRYYTDELVSTLLEVLEGPVPCMNLFMLADGNRPDMVDEAFAARRLTHIPFPGLSEEDRTGVIESVLTQNDTPAERIDEVAGWLIDQTYADTRLCELVMADESRVALTSDHILTPAMIRNVVRGAYGDAASQGRPEIVDKDVELAWGRELDAQSLRFGETQLADILGLDRQKASRIVCVERRGE